MSDHIELVIIIAQTKPSPANHIKDTIKIGLGYYYLIKEERYYLTMIFVLIFHY